MPEGLMPMIVFMDGERHRAMRSLLSRVFTPMRMAKLEEGIRASARDLLDAADRQGHRGADAGFDKRLDRFGVANGEHRHVLEPLADDFGEHGGGVLGFPYEHEPQHNKPIQT